MQRGLLSYLAILSATLGIGCGNPDEVKAPNAEPVAKGEAELTENARLLDASGGEVLVITFTTSLRAEVTASVVTAQSP